MAFSYLGHPLGGNPSAFTFWYPVINKGSLSRGDADLNSICVE